MLQKCEIPVSFATFPFRTPRRRRKSISFTVHYRVLVSLYLTLVALPSAVTAPRRKPLMQDAFKPVRAVEGCPARIEGRVSGHPPPTITWLKDGKPLDASDHARPYLLPDGTFGLTFDRCLPEDSGSYSARISNSEGDAQADAKMEVIGEIGGWCSSGILRF